MMKPDYLPLYRDGGRLLVADLAVSAKSRSQRLRSVPGKQAMRLLVWPNARWWRARAVASPDDLPESRHATRDGMVLASWERLGMFREWDVATFADAIHLLVETPAVESYGAEPMPERGGDPRPSLADRERLREWLVAKADLWDVAIVALAADGRLGAEAARRLRRHRPTQERCVDPHALVHFRCTADLLSIRWPDRAVRSSLPLFRGGSLGEVRRAVEFVETWMAEEGKVAEMRRFLLAAKAETAAPWLVRIAAIRCPKQRCYFLERLGVAEARLRSPHRVSVNLVQRIEQRVRRRGGVLELDGLFTVVEHGLDPVVLEDAFALAEAFASPRTVPEIPDRVGGRPDPSALIGLGRRFVREDAGWLVFRFWRVALQSREIRREIEKESWREFPDEAARDWVRLLLELNKEKVGPREFTALVGRLRRSILDERPEHRAKKAAVLRVLLSYSKMSGDLRLFDDLEHFAGTVARGFVETPFRAIDLFDDFREAASVDQRWSLANLPRSAIKQMEEAARSCTDRAAILEGAQMWFRELPEVDPALHFRRPKRFLDALREHPGFGVDPLRIDLREACCLFDMIVGEGETDPVPTKLRHAACGRLVLGSAALDHYREAFAAGLADYQIDLLRAEIRRVEGRYRTAGCDPHTVRFLATMGPSNRRSLKRLVHAIRAGDRGYRDAHPANRAWLARHGHLSLDPWTRRGAEAFPVSFPGVEGAFVRLEDDPQEELKMGSYFDTCLGLGGCNQHGAVANTLDINKRVAYLRDMSGKVLARQLLAISEQEELVPFCVYESQGGDRWKECERVFREFDEHLASLLGLPLMAKGGEYEIKPLVARDWYDDGAWAVEGPL